MDTVQSPVPSQQEPNVPVDTNHPQTSSPQNGGWLLVIIVIFIAGLLIGIGAIFLDRSARGSKKPDSYLKVADSNMPSSTPIPTSIPTIDSFPGWPTLTLKEVNEIILRHPPDLISEKDGVNVYNLSKKEDPKKPFIEVSIMGVTDDLITMRKIIDSIQRLYPTDFVEQQLGENMVKFSYTREVKNIEGVIIGREKLVQIYKKFNYGIVVLQGFQDAETHLTQIAQSIQIKQ